MKILFICDFSPTSYEGGAEISSFWQAEKLKKKGIKVFFLYRKKSNNFISFCGEIIKTVKSKKIDLIHCQGKYSWPAVFLSKIIFKKPAILTLRDYKGICPHGFCLYHKNKSCNLVSFFKEDFLFYYQNYIKNKNPLSFLIQLMFSYFGRLKTLVLSFFIKRADKLVCVSQ